MKDFLKSVLKELKFKKIVALLLLILCFVFIIMQHASFEYGVDYLNDQKITQSTIEQRRAARIDFRKFPDKTDDMLRYQSRIASHDYIEISGDDVVTQTFTAADNLIKQVKIYFINDNSFNAKGDITVTIIDKNGKDVCSSTLKTQLVLNDFRTIFDFVDDSKALNENKILTNKYTIKKSEGVSIKKGEKYTIEIKCDNVSSDGRVCIHLCDEQYDDDNEMTVNGKSQGGSRIFGGVFMIHTNYTIFAIFIAGLLFAFLVILLPFGYIGEKTNRDVDRLLLRILFFMTPFICFWLTYKIAGFKSSLIIMKMFTFQGFLNFAIITLLWFVIYGLTNRTKLTVIFMTFITMVFCLANYMLIVFRGSPLVATDFASIGTAMDVAASYTLTFNKSSLWVITGSIIIIAIALALKSYKGLAAKKRIALLCAAAVAVGCFYGLFFKSDFLKDNNLTVSGFRPSKSYNKRGYVLAFTITTTTSRVEKPDGYSLDRVKEITSQYQSDKGQKNAEVSKKSPNIIAIMNESFSDLTMLGDFTTSDDFMPFFRSLKENTIKGVMHPSIFGGGTADSEFEFLTGQTLQFLPFHIVPYNNYINDEFPSLTRTLKAQGYKGNISFHPGEYNSYNRNNVYPLLGFDDFISVEDLKDPEKIRAFVSDQADYDVVIDEYEKYKETGKKNPYYMFNVTIQNHGAYLYSNGVVKKMVTITDAGAYDESAEQFINLMKYSDMAFENLVNYFKSVDEPTVIVMFGDHQPSLSSQFYKVMNQRNPKNTDLEETAKKFVVPFIIWANYDIKEQSDVQISANYLAPYMLDVIGAKKTGFDKFLLDTYKKVPVTSAICYIGDDGIMHDIDEVSAYTELLEKYRMVEYNCIVDHENRDSDFFFLK